MPKKEKSVGSGEQVLADVTAINKRLDSLDDRLDNIDSMISAVAERVMSQLITLHITCPHCGKEVEIGIVGSQKPLR